MCKPNLTHLFCKFHLRHKTSISYPLRYFSGVTPTIFLNALKNDCLLPNPTIAPMSSTEYASNLLSLKCRIASFILHPCTTSAYPIPYSFRIILDSVHPDTPSISANSPAENLGSRYFLPLINISSICPFNISSFILSTSHQSVISAQQLSFPPTKLQIFVKQKNTKSKKLSIANAQPFITIALFCFP